MREGGGEGEIKIFSKWSEHIYVICLSKISRAKSRVKNTKLKNCFFVSSFIKTCISTRCLLPMDRVRYHLSFDV